MTISPEIILAIFLAQALLTAIAIGGVILLALRVIYMMDVTEVRRIEDYDPEDEYESAASPLNGRVH